MSHHKIHDRKVIYPGDTLIREGDAGDVAYFIESGTLGVYKRAGNTEIQIAVLQKNSIVGEMELIDNSRRNASVRCLDTATVVAIDRKTFERKIHHLDRFTRALLETFVSRLQLANSSHAELRKITANAHEPYVNKPLGQIDLKDDRNMLDAIWVELSVHDKFRLIKLVGDDERIMLIELLSNK